MKFWQTTLYINKRTTNTDFNFESLWHFPTIRPQICGIRAPLTWTRPGTEKSPLPIPAGTLGTILLHRDKNKLDLPISVGFSGKDYNFKEKLNWLFISDTFSER